jgi:hypothetical protein
VKVTAQHREVASVEQRVRDRINGARRRSVAHVAAWVSDLVDQRKRIGPGTRGMTGSNAEDQSDL